MFGQRSVRHWMLGALLTPALGAAAAGQSGFHDPDAPLAVFPVGESPALSAAADRLYREAQKSVVELEQWQRAGGMQAGKIGTTHVTIIRLERVAARLKARHEAAGFDFSLRGGNLKQRLLQMATELKMIQGFSTKSAADSLAALRDAGLPKIPGWQKQLSQGELAKVETEVYALLDAMQEHLIWLEGNAVSEYVLPFEGVASAVAGQTAESDRRKAEADLDQQLAQLQPSAADLCARLQAAATAIERDEVADWQGEMQSGPQIVAAAHQEWQQTQRELLRRRALLWARRGASRGSTPELMEVDEGLRTLAEQMPASLAALVAGDARRVAAADAAELYRQYVPILGSLVVRGPREELHAALGPALDIIAAKAPQLNAELRSYRALTGELLRWRRKLATAEAEARRKDYPLATSAISETAKSRLGSPGFLAEQGQGSESSAILTPVPLAISRVGKELTGRTVTVRSLVGDGNRELALYAARTLSTMPAPDDSTRSGLIESLRTILYLAPEHSPLSLEGAAALAAAEEGVWDSAGGAIENVQVAPLIVRTATLQEKDSLRFPLGPLAEEPVQLDLRQHLVVQLRIQPAWMQHELLLIELP